jgi:hypothetical protein
MTADCMTAGLHDYMTFTPTLTGPPDSVRSVSSTAKLHDCKTAKLLVPRPSSLVPCPYISHPAL